MRIDTIPMDNTAMQTPELDVVFSLIEEHLDLYKNVSKQFNESPESASYFGNHSEAMRDFRKTMHGRFPAYVVKL